VVSKGGSESRDQLTRLQHEFIESVAICSNNPGPLSLPTRVHVAKLPKALWVTQQVS
jgi:hypothetical protein